MSRSLADFDPHHNGITAVRLALACTVVVSHAFAVGGLAVEPLVELSGGSVSLGLVAVIAFFALSGFLIASSRERTEVLPFVRNRAVRILPGYWLSLLFVAVIAAPIAGMMTNAGPRLGEVAGYVGPRLLFIPEIAGATPLSDTFGGLWINGSLWTLGVELLCYMMLALVPARLGGHVAAGEAALLCLLWAAAPAFRGPDTALMFAFAVGVVGWRWRHRIPVSAPVVAASVVLAGIALVNGWALPLAGCIAYVAMASAWLPVRLETDLSYGVYVLAYPIQVLLVLAGVRSTGVLPMIGATLVIVIPLAWLSWTLVERPALALRHRRARVALLGERVAAQPAAATLDVLPVSAGRR